MKKCIVRRIKYVSKDITLPKLVNPYYLRATPKTTWVSLDTIQKIQVESNVDWKVK